MGNSISIEVVYAQAGAVWRVVVKMATGSTVEQALAASEFAERFPAYPQESLAVGIYGQVRKLNQVLVDGDRIEIYRPLTFDPMESRRRRAEHRKAFMTKRLSRT
ncbi:hypothetical protein PT7_1052 [Pusillimonas sp. T7-7]|uniref:RnfH family protein n=1 Tax=Pusillimonas sp. (strain T7-7) TaxID=1007105 RepID=UPI00020852A1|nr:RnfH family protein [Pusillimonas sp. T7-7]AEC19592.1 hypothetical protein PT7_1052 [Pusillimonas sp. T7-7]